MNKNIEGVLIRYHRERLGMTQEEVALDICVPSYLSKIEGGTTNADRELIHLIFKRLNVEYRDDATFIEQGNKLLNSFLRELEYFGDRKSIFKKIEKEEKSFLNSPLLIKYLEVKALNEVNLSLYMEKIGSSAPILATFIESMSDEELALYYIIKACYEHKDELISESYFKKSQIYKKSSYGYILWMYEYYINGSYGKILELYNIAINQAFDEGNVMAMMHINLLVANSHASVGDIQRMLPYYERCKNLLMLTNDRFYNFIINRNLMIAYGMTKEYEKAIEQYKLAIKYRPNDEERFHMELIISELYFNKRDIKKAIEHFNKAQFLADTILINELEHEQMELVKIKLNDRDYLNNKRYLEILENIVFIKSKDRQKSFYYAYVSELETLYCYLRQYKKAYQLTKNIPEKSNIS